MKKGTKIDDLDNYVTITLFIDDDAYAASLQCGFDDTLDEDSEAYMLKMGYGVLTHLNSDGDRLAELGSAMLMGMVAESGYGDDSIAFDPEEDEEEAPTPNKDKVVPFKTKGNKTRH
jgi:hypothetical protein